MKTIILLTFLWMASFPLLASENLPLWSGREQTLPGNGKWELLSSHGRVLATGTGDIKIQLAALADGARVQAKLKTENNTRDVTLLSPRIFAGIAATFACEGSSPLPEKFNELGMVDAKEITIYMDSATPMPRIHIADKMMVVENDLTLVFPQNEDFPIQIGQNWEKISLNTAKQSGTLGVYINGNDQTVTCCGNGNFIEMLQGNTKVVLFEPDFDLDEPNNIITIENLMEGYQK